MIVEPPVSRLVCISEILFGRKGGDHFCRGAELVKINSIEKQVAKSSKSDDFATPQNIPESRRKIVRPNEFF